MVREPLKEGEVIELNNKKYTINTVLGDGATCIVYSAKYIDKVGFSHNVNIKECYPFNVEVTREGQVLNWNSEEEKKCSLSAFQNTYKKLISFQHDNFVTQVFDICDNNGTKYIIMDANKGQTFDKIKYDNLKDILKTVKLLAYVVGEYHKNGCLHLDIKPSNFLVYPRPSEHIVLFDLDTVTSIDEINNGNVKCVSYSDSWAAPEQKQGKLSQVCPATDIFAIGAILFEKIFNRQIESFDTSIFADWDFENDFFQEINPKVKRLLRNILKKTISANVKRRYQNIDELLVDIEEVIKASNQKQYLISPNIISDIDFIGREFDLQKIDELFENGTKAIFLHGFGGVGKTALATRYAELNSNKYDCVKFCRYTNGLAQIIDGLEIANTEKEDGAEHRKHLKTILNNSKTLLIIDNFDVDDDEELSELLELNCNLLFTTRNDFSQYFSAEKIEIVELESLPTEMLVQVFKNEYGKELTVDEELLVEAIIEKFGNITMLVPMIAKQIIASHISIEEFYSSIEDDVFSCFNDENEDIRIKKDGKLQKINSLNYLRAMFNISELPNECVTVLQYLYLLRYHNDLTVEGFKKYTNTKNLNILNELAFRNWVTIEDNGYNNDSEITVHQLIYDLIEKDFYPTYESVPGIAKYIDDCFEIIKKMTITDKTSEDDVINWELAKCITFALLMYDDIRISENRESCAEKTACLFAFMSVAFLEDAQKVYELFFQSPEESNYSFYVSGLMDWFCNFGEYAEKIDTYNNWLSIMSKDGLSFVCQDENKFEFESEEEKFLFLENIKNELENISIDFYKQLIINIPYFVMCCYFANKSSDFQLAEKSSRILCTLESYIEEHKTSAANDVLSDGKILKVRLEFYFAICKIPEFDKCSNQQKANGIDVAANYRFYQMIIGLLQKALNYDFEDEENDELVHKANEIIILLEEANGLHAWYGLSKQDILDYIPPSLEEMQNNQRLHWSKKAKRWYESFETTVEKCDNPFYIYKSILSCNSIDISMGCSKILSQKSRYNELVKNGFVDRMFSHERLSSEEKSSLLYEFIFNEVYILSSDKHAMRTLVRKNPTILEIYFDIISRIEYFYPDFYNGKMSDEKILPLYNIFILRRYLKKDIPHVNEYIEKCISAENIGYLGELFYFVDQIRRQGYIKKSQELKHKILDLCDTVDLSDLTESQIQLILYKITPFAKKHNKQDVLRKIGLDEKNISRKYYLELLVAGTHIFPTTSAQISIACRFLDEYIESVAIEAYNQMHNGLAVEFLDEMEKQFLKYDYFLFLYANMHSNSYARIFGNRAFGEGSPQGAVRQLSPLELSQYTYGSYDPIVDIGVCYLLAKAYDDISCDSMFNCPLEAVIDNDGSEKDYTLSSKEIQEVLENIQKICPKAKKDIERYLEISQS